MKSRLIQNSKEELASFVSAYEKLTGYNVDTSFLEKSKVRAFYLKNNQLIGGYATSSLENNSTLRYLEFLGSEKETVLAQSGFQNKLNDVIEITYIFFTRRASSFQRKIILSYSVFDVLFSRKKIVFGGGVVSKFNARMKTVLPKELFSGNVMVYGNLKQFTILYTETEYLLRSWFVAILKELFIIPFSKFKTKA